MIHRSVGVDKDGAGVRLFSRQQSYISMHSGRRHERLRARMVFVAASDTILSIVAAPIGWTGSCPFVGSIH